MRITCPNCETSYQLADGALGATGRKVRCTRCGKTWHATPAAEPPPDPVQAWAAAAGHEEPSEEDWKAALNEGPTSTERDAAPDAAADDPWAAAAEEDERPPRARPEATTADPGSNVVPFRRETEDPSATPDDAPAAAKTTDSQTIEQDPAGFPPAADAEDRPRKRRPAKPVRKRRSGPRFHIRSGAVAGVTAGFLVLAAIAGVFAREDVVRLFPELARLYALVGVEVNLRGLAFETISTVREMDGATPVLVVSGVVRNVVEELRPVPRIRFGLISRTGREVYAWTMDPAQPELDGGATMSFKSRLPAPPEAAADVQVRFTDDEGP